MAAPGEQVASRVGVLGGSFDPPHWGHLLLAQDAREQFALDRVLLMPCHQSPHKPGRRPAAAEHRRAMLLAALEGAPGLELCDLELQRGGVSYTVDTLEQLQALQPGARWCWIIGADMLPDLHAWRAVNRLFTRCDFIVCERPGAAPVRIPPEAWGLTPRQAQSVMRYRMTGRALALSSSEIRARVRAGRTIHDRVPPAVEAYISRHRLYR